MTRKIQIITFCLCLFLFFGSGKGSGQDSSLSAKKVEISAIENVMTHALIKDVVREAYKRIGYEVVFFDLPAQRALVWAEEGQTDGDLARIRGTEKDYPHLVPVPTPVVFFQGVAFAKTVTDPIATWEDVRKYTVGIIRGIRYAEIGTQGMAVVEAKDMTHLFTLLDSGRIQIAIAGNDDGLIEAEKNFKGRGIHMIGPPLFSAPLFHFLNKKNEKLVDPLNAVLREMAESGEMEAIHRKAFERKLKGGSD